MKKISEFSSLMFARPSHDHFFSPCPAPGTSPQFFARPPGSPGGGDGNRTILMTHKTWFQAYLQSRYGYERVVRMDLKARQQDLLHALSRRHLCAADIFLFNVPRACEENDFCSYSTLESINDGNGTSIKYHSAPGQFRTPNVFIVLSNIFVSVQHRGK